MLALSFIKMAFKANNNGLMAGKIFQFNFRIYEIRSRPDTRQEGSAYPNPKPNNWRVFRQARQTALGKHFRIYAFFEYLFSQMLVCAFIFN